MPILKRGNRGPLVIKAQEELSALGFPLVVDGIFGGNMQQAVFDFQKSIQEEGIPIRIDGIIGQETQGHINRRLGSVAPSPMESVTQWFSSMDWQTITVMSVVAIGLVMVAFPKK